MLWTVLSRHWAICSFESELYSHWTKVSGHRSDRTKVSGHRTKVSGPRPEKICHGSFFQVATEGRIVLVTRFDDFAKKAKLPLLVQWGSKEIFHVQHAADVRLQKQ